MSDYIDRNGESNELCPLSVLFGKGRIPLAYSLFIIQIYNLRERGGIRLTFIQLHAISIIFHWFEPFSGFGHLRLAFQVYWWKLFTASEGKLKESNGGALNHNNYAHCLLHNGHCSTTQLPICSFGQLAISPFIRCFILTRSALNSGSVQVCPGLCPVYQYCSNEHIVLPLHWPFFQVLTLNISADLLSSSRL